MSERRTFPASRGFLRWASLAIAAVALIVLAVALVVTPGSRFNTVSYAALGVAVAGLAGFVLADPAAFTAMVTGRTGQFGLTTALLSIVFVAFVVALYAAIWQLNIAPLDVGESQRYTLSEATVELLEGIEEPIHVTAFYTDGSVMRDEAQIWLDAYRRASDGALTYEFVDPEREPGLAQQYGVSQLGVLIFEQGDRSTQVSSLTERDLTGAVGRVLLGGRRQAYAVSGHGERNLNGFEASGFSEARRALTNANFALEELNLLEAGAVPEDADLLLIAGPTAQFNPREVDMLSAYLESGGSALILSDPATGGGAFGNGVSAVDVSADGTLIATAGADGTARIWDAETGEELRVLRGHASDAVGVAFLPDGERVVTAGRDNTVRVWDVASGEPIAELAGETDGLVAVAVSPDGSLIASAGENQTVNVWDAETYEPLGYSPLTAPAPLWTVAFSPTGETLAAAGGVGGESGPVYAWDAATGEPVFNQRLHADLVLGMAFAADGDVLHTAALDGTEGIVELASGQASTVPRFPDLGLTAIAVAPDGTTAYAIGDGSVRVRPAGAAGEPDDAVLEGHTNIIWDMAFTPDGARLVTAGRDGEARIWDVSSGETVAVLGGHSAVDPLLAYLEAEWAIDVNDDLVVDVANAQYFDELTPVVAEGYNSISPITAPLLQAGRPSFFSVARSISFTADEGSPVTHTALLTTAPGLADQVVSWGETTNPFAAGGQLSFDEADNPGPVVLGLSATNTETGARVVVIGDADFASNQALQYGTFGNAELLVNAAEWLAQGEDTIELPPPDFDVRTIERPFTPVGLYTTAIAVSCLVPLAIAAGGAVLWFARRRQR